MIRPFTAFLLTLIFVPVILAAETPKPAPSSAATAATPADTRQLSPLEQQLIAFEKAMPEAQKKKDMDFYKRTLTDDFVAVGTDAKVHSRNEILDDLQLHRTRRVPALRHPGRAA